MYTVCPKCALTLVVTAADLRIAQGFVRCGRCSNVFNALARLSEDRNALPQGVASATQSLPIPPPQPPAPQPPAPQPSATQPVAPQSIAPQPIAPQAGLRDSVRRESTAPVDESHPALPVTDADPLFEAELEFDAAATDINKVFVEQTPDPEWSAATGRFKALTRQVTGTLAKPFSASSPQKAPPTVARPAATTAQSAAPPAAAPHATPPAPQITSTAQTASTFVQPIATSGRAPQAVAQITPLARGVPTSAPSAPAAPAAPPAAQGQSGLPASTTFSFADAATAPSAQGGESNVTAASASATETNTARADGSDVGLDVINAVAEARLAAAALQKDESAPLSPLDARPQSLPDNRNPALRFLWTAGTVALALLLSVQIVHHYRHDLAANPRFYRPLTALYAAFGVQLIPRWNLEAYDVRQLGASADNSSAGRITVRASVKNTAKQSQPLPFLRVTLQDLFGNRIATRDVPPRAYLPGAGAPGASPDSSFLSAGQRIDAQMVFIDPGANAVGFEIDACLPAPGGSIACANDSAPR